MLFKTTIQYVHNNKLQTLKVSDFELDKDFNDPKTKDYERKDKKLYLDIIEAFKDVSVTDFIRVVDELPMAIEGVQQRKEMVTKLSELDLTVL